jgi:hypothetical protein
MTEDQIKESMQWILTNGPAVLRNFQISLREVIVFNQEFDSIDQLVKEMMAISKVTSVRSGDNKIKTYGVIGETENNERVMLAWCGNGPQSERMAQFIAIALLNFLPALQLINDIVKEIKETVKAEDEIEIHPKIL